MVVEKMSVTNNIIIGSILAAVIILAIIPAAAAYTVTNVQSTTISSDNGPINLTIDSISDGDPITIIISSSNQQISGGSISLPTITMPFRLKSGTSTETFSSSGISDASMTVSRNDGSAVTMSGSSFTENYNINSGQYTISVAGTQTSSQTQVRFSVSGQANLTTPSTETISLPLSSAISGIVTIEVDGGTSTFTKTFTITPPSSETTTVTSGDTVPLTVTSSVSPSGGGSSTLQISSGTTVTLPSGNGNTGSIYVAPVSGSVPSTTFTSGSTTFSFAGQAVECGPSGTQFSGAGTTISFTLTPSQWATALSNAGGSTAGLTVRYYDPTTSTWIGVPTTVDATTYTVTGTITHFTSYGVFSQEPTITVGGQDASSSNGVVAAAAAPPAILAPTGYSPTVVTLSHDSQGILTLDYTLETDPAAGFSAALGVSKGTGVVSGAGQPVREIAVTPLSPIAVNTSLKQGGNTLTFSGFAVEGEPAGTRLVGGNATISFALNQTQWAAALSQVDGNTAAIMIETYNNATNTWAPLATTTVDTNTYTISSKVPQLGTYAVYYQTSSPVGGQGVSPQITSTPAANDEKLVTPAANTQSGGPEASTPAVDQGVVGNLVLWIQHFIGH